MKKVSSSLVLSVTACSIAFASISSILLLGTSLHRNLKIYSCTNAKDGYLPISHIIQSGPEYLLVDNKNEWQRNSFLVSKEMNKLPLNWKFKGMNIASSSWSGFELQSRDQNKKPIHTKVRFSAIQQKLSIYYADNPYTKNSRPVLTLKCQIDSSLLATKIEKVINNVPIAYLEQRSSGFALLRPKISNTSFNKILSDRLAEKNHSEYSQYQLLKARNKSTLLAKDKSKLEALRKTLINSNSRSATVREYQSEWYWWEYENEKEEAAKHARSWCKNQSFGNKKDLIKNGYTIISTDSVSIETPGWQKHLYPDMRFAGYVKYKTRCGGKQYNLILNKGVDNTTENTY